MKRTIFRTQAPLSEPRAHVTLTNVGTHGVEIRVNGYRVALFTSEGIL